MFHWICPECGREISPSVRACQACDPSAVASTVVEPVQSALLVEAAAPTPLPAVIDLKPEPQTAGATPAEPSPEPVAAEQVRHVEAAPEPEPAVAEVLAAEPEPVAAQVADVEVASAATQPEAAVAEARAAETPY